MYKRTECTALKENASNSVSAGLRFKNTSLLDLKTPPYYFVPPCFSFTRQKDCILMTLPPEMPDFHLDK